MSQEKKEKKCQEIYVTFRFPATVGGFFITCFTSPAGSGNGKKEKKCQITYVTVRFPAMVGGFSSPAEFGKEYFEVSEPISLKSNHSLENKMT